MSLRKKAIKNLLIFAVNTAIKNGLDLNIWEDIVDPLGFSVDVIFPSGSSGYITYRNIGYGEVSLHVFYLPRRIIRPNCEFTPCRKIAEACTYGWLERKDGKYIIENPCGYFSKNVLQIISSWDIAPIGGYKYGGGNFLCI